VLPATRARVLLFTAELINNFGGFGPSVFKGGG